MGVSTLRLERTSLYNYIKYEVLPTEFSETLTESLIWDSSLNGYVTNSLMEPSPVSRGRGWVIFEDNSVNGKIIVDTTSEQSTKVSVTGASSYTIDYVRGVIKNPNTVPTSVTYSWNYVSVLKSWPGETPPPLPIVSLSSSRSAPAGFQLGGGRKNLREAQIHVFATSDEERDDLVSHLEDGFYNKQISIKDYSSGDYLNYDGTFNTGFSPSLVDGSPMIIQEVTSRPVIIQDEFYDLNRYRSVLNIVYETYKD